MIVELNFDNYKTLYDIIEDLLFISDNNSMEMENFNECIIRCSSINGFFHKLGNSLNCQLIDGGKAT